MKKELIYTLFNIKQIYFIFTMESKALSENQSQIFPNEERRKQQELSQAHESVVSGKITESYVMECISETDDEKIHLTEYQSFTVNNKEFKAQLRTEPEEKAVITKNEGDECYAVVYEFSFADNTYTIVDQVYEAKNVAFENKKSIGDEIQFKFDTKGTISTHNPKNKKERIMYKSKKMLGTLSFNSFILLSVV